MSIRLRLSLLIITLFITAISNVAFTFLLGNLAEEKLKWVNYTHEVLYTKEGLLSSMKDAETGQRGYLLTRDTSYLEPYYSGLNLSREQFLRLQRLTSDNPDQQLLLRKISEQMNLKFEELAETIALAQKGEMEEAYTIVSNDHGKYYMDTIREHFSAFTNNERILLEKRKGNFRESRAEITTLIFVELAVFIALSLITFLFLHRSVFSPLKLLIGSASRIKRGKKLKPRDIVTSDEMGHLLSAFYDMGEKVYEREQALNHEARHDNLTGLLNRTTALGAIKESVARAQQSNLKSAVLFVDLNTFKQINDSMGHDVGDHILKETALRLSDAVRSTDTVFRYGGDEFLIILNEVEGTHNVVEVITNVLKEFDAPVSIKGNPIDIGVSIGAAVAPDDSVIASELIEFSDIAMYASKRDKHAPHKLFQENMLKRAGDTQSHESD